MHVRVETAGREDVAIGCHRCTATGLSHSGGDRNERKQRLSLDGHARGKRRIGIKAVSDIILQIVVNTEAGADRPPSLAGRVPRYAHTWLQECLGVVVPKR